MARFLSLIIVTFLQPFPALWAVNQILIALGVEQIAMTAEIYWSLVTLFFLYC